MLILAVATISMIVGENGVIEKGEKANSVIEQKSIEETIQTSYYYNKDSAGKLQYKETKEAIDKNLKAAGYTVSVDDGIDFPITVTATGKTGTYIYIVEQTGKIRDENTEPYYFTFNMISSITNKNIIYEEFNAEDEYDTTISGVFVEAKSFWNKVGKNLSGLYGVSIAENETAMTLLGNTISSNDTSLFTEFHKEAEVSDSENLFILFEADEYIGIYLVKNPNEPLDIQNGTNVYGIVTTDENQVEGILSWTEFVNTYGDIKFYFDGTIKEEVELTDLEKYILGKNGNGRPFTEIVLLSSDSSFVDDESTPLKENEALTGLAFIQEKSGDYVIYFKYNNEIYKFAVDIMNEPYNTNKDYGVVKVDTKEGELTLEEYILGEDKTGRELAKIYNGTTFIEFEYVNSTVHEKIKLSRTEQNSENEDLEIYYIRYETDIYMIETKFNENGVEITSKLEKIEDAQGNLGKYVKYKDINWIILSEDEEKIELITADALSEVALGGEELEDTRTSYNNAIETLVQACKTITGIENNIRNVGGPEEDTTTGTITFSSLKIFKPSYDLVSFTACNGFKVGNSDYLSDYDKMYKIGIAMADNEKQYWLGSREVSETEEAVNFKVKYVTYEGEASVATLYHVGNGIIRMPHNLTKAIRPIITLEASVLDSVTQKGFIDDPIILED